MKRGLLGLIESNAGRTGLTEPEFVVAMDAAFKAGGTPEFIYLRMSRETRRWRGRRYNYRACAMLDMLRKAARGE